MFGVATADHQCEAFVQKWSDVRDVFDSRLRLAERGDATNFWSRCKEDIRLAAGLGCNAFRFSLAWARIEPRPGSFDRVVLDHYLDVARSIRAAGMEPIVTLHHYTWPLHIEETGGMTDPEFPSRFAAYASEASGALSGIVRYWITINEPTELVFGYVKPWWEGEYGLPPGRRPDGGLEEQFEQVGKLIPNLFRAHTLAREAIQAVSPSARISANPLILGLPSPLRWFLDHQMTRLRDRPHLTRRLKSTAHQRIPDRPDADLVIALLAATPDRGRTADFSVPYETGNLGLLVSVESHIVTMDDISDGPIVVVRGTSAKEVARSYLPAATVLTTDGYPSALRVVAEGRVVALLADEVVLNHIADERFRTLDHAIATERHVVAVPKNRLGLLAAVNEVIEAKDRAPDAGAPAGLTREEGWLTVGVRGGLPGVSFQDPATGKWSGSEVLLARRVATYLVGSPDHVRFKPVRADDKLKMLRPWVGPVDRVTRWLGTVFTILNSNWWHLGMAGELPQWLCPADCVGKQDFVGFDYYWGVPTRRFWRLGALNAAAHGQFQAAPVWPGGLRSSIHYLRRKFRSEDILIVENGSVEVADGIPRGVYLMRHLDQVVRSLNEGVQLIGYVYWSITTNREWGLSFAPGNDFGLYHIDLDRDAELQRRPTASANAYSEFIRGFRSSGQRRGFQRPGTRSSRQ